MPPHAATDGLTRNAGRRPPREDIEQWVIDQKVKRVIVRGYSHPITTEPVDIQLPDDYSVFSMGVARKGGFYNLSVFCEQIVDGPAYLRVYNQDGIMKDAADKNMEFALVSDDWASGELFALEQGDRLRFRVDNVRDFSNERPDDIALLTGSPTLSIAGTWITGVYWAEGSDLGSDQQPTRALT